MNNNNKTYQKPVLSGGELTCSERENSSGSTSGIFKKNLVIIYERGKRNRPVTTTNGIYLTLCATDIPQGLSKFRHNVLYPIKLQISKKRKK